MIAYQLKISGKGSKSQVNVKSGVIVEATPAFGWAVGHTFLHVQHWCLKRHIKVTELGDANHFPCRALVTKRHDKVPTEAELAERTK